MIKGQEGKFPTWTGQLLLTRQLLICGTMGSVVTYFQFFKRNQASDVDIQVAIFKTLRGWGQVGSDVSKSDRVGSSRGSSFHKKQLKKWAKNLSQLFQNSGKQTKITAIKWMLNQGGNLQTAGDHCSIFTCPCSAPQLSISFEDRSPCSSMRS